MSTQQRVRIVWHGRGSEFVVRLGIAAAVAPAPDTVAGKDAAAADAARPVRIVLADDNRDACDSLEMLLTLEKHDVCVAYDGTTALAVMAEFRPQLALLDIGMPGMNGYELAARVREQPWGAGIYLVAARA